MADDKKTEKKEETKKTEVSENWVRERTRRIVVPLVLVLIAILFGRNILNYGKQLFTSSSPEVEVRLQRPPSGTIVENIEPEVLTLTLAWSKKFVLIDKRINGVPITPDCYYQIRIDGDDNKVSGPLAPPNVASPVHYEIPAGAHYVELRVYPGQPFRTSQYKIWWSEPGPVQYQYITRN